MTAQASGPAPRIVLRKPSPRDGAALHQLIAQCPPLDLNSLYAYLLLGEHHADTCVVAEADGKLVGAVTAYFPPAQTDTLFIWQVAVAPAMQGCRLASRMLDHLIARCAAQQHLGCVEATISPSNAASRKLFAGLAARHGVVIHSRLHYSAADFGSGHEEEWLYRLGPWPHQPASRPVPSTIHPGEA
ncbi:MAG TPA: diaminobutyrate acetyltransferase [Oxalicibacterium sp.]|jgi:L-2,4-diaminobutyric acid acetyltransferase|nr:diaminobutyrate acetyltransferase [Oxalicibacterium sp.]